VCLWCVGVVCVCGVCVCVCGVCVCMCVWCVYLYCMLHYYAVILHALMFTFTHYLLLSTYSTSIYSVASYVAILDYTLYFVQYYAVREFFEEFVEFYTKCVFIHWPVF